MRRNWFHAEKNILIFKRLTNVDDDCLIGHQMMGDNNYFKKIDQRRFFKMHFMIWRNKIAQFVKSQGR